MPRPNRGFTLVELIIVLALMAVLTTIAIPSFADLSVRNRVTADINQLNATLQGARSTALGNGVAVIVCPGDSSSGCRDHGRWERGWFSFTDPDGDRDCELTASGNRCTDGGRILNVIVPTTGGTLRATGEPSKRVRYTPLGHADGYLGTFKRCSADGETAAGFTLIMTGRLRRVAPEDITCP